MHSLIPLLVVAAAVCARPPGPTLVPYPQPRQQRLPKVPNDYLGEYYLPRILIPQYLGYEDHHMPALPPQNNDWLNKEIYRINQMDDEAENIGTYEKDIARMIVQDPYLIKMFESPTIRDREEAYIQGGQQSVAPLIPSALIAPDLQDTALKTYVDKKEHLKNAKAEQRKHFALTPFDKGYFDPYSKSNEFHATQTAMGHHEGGDISSVQIEPPRQIRQNPNLSKTKNLVADHLDRLRNGLLTKEYRLPVSLLPTNLGWLKMNHIDEESSGDEAMSTEKPRSIRLPEAVAADPADPVYGIAVIAAVGTALTLVIVGFGFGWYRMSKRAKAAADVDYPAYGVTGPTIDMSGDRKLAHSAHMYHYQHQKQQIIAMERNGLEQRNGSVSDPESEEENEEGDYTVYECPGFATTGDMEVKNPMFSEDPTPATPGKCELVKPQPKD